MIKEQKGITLVALVITIIVLLILAAVSIAALSGKNGILTNASDSRTETFKAQAKEAVSMAVSEILTNKYAGAASNNELTKANVESTIKKNYSGLTATVTTAPEASPEKEGQIKIEDDKYSVVVTTSGSWAVKSVGDVTSISK